MGGVVQFNYADWQAQFPQFSTTVTSSQQAQAYFNMACVYCSNAANAVVCNLVVRTQMLYLLTAHIAQLMVGTNGNPATPLVGRISDATQGTVNVKAEMPDADANSAWFLQTQFGAMYWQMTAPYRLSRVAVGPGQRPAPAPVFPGLGVSYPGGNQ